MDDGDLGVTPVWNEAVYWRQSQEEVAPGAMLERTLLGPSPVVFGERHSLVPCLMATLGSRECQAAL